MATTTTTSNSTTTEQSNVGLFSCSTTSKQERIVRFMAGMLVLLSVSLAHFTQNMNWLWLTLFVGANLFQSSLTRWCLLNNILSKLGIRS